MRGTDNFVARRDSLAAPSGVGRFVVPGLGLGCLLSYVLCFVRRFDAGLAPAGFERLTTFMYGALIALALAGFASLALGGGARAARRGEAAEGGGERAGAAPGQAPVHEDTPDVRPCVAGVTLCLLATVALASAAFGAGLGLPPLFCAGLALGVGLFLVSREWFCLSALLDPTDLLLSLAVAVALAGVTQALFKLIVEPVFAVVLLVLLCAGTLSAFVAFGRCVPASAFSAPDVSQAVEGAASLLAVVCDLPEDLHAPRCPLRPAPDLHALVDSPGGSGLLCLHHGPHLGSRAFRRDVLALCGGRGARRVRGCPGKRARHGPRRLPARRRGSLRHARPRGPAGCHLARACHPRHQAAREWAGHRRLLHDVLCRGVCAPHGRRLRRVLRGSGRDALRCPPLGLRHLVAVRPGGPCGPGFHRGARHRRAHPVLHPRGGVLHGGCRVLCPALASLVAPRLCCRISRSPPREVQTAFDEGAFEARCRALADKCGLSPRELEVLRYAGRGYGSSYIAPALGISENTVRTHVRHIYEKLGVSGRAALIALLDSHEV